MSLDEKMSYKETMRQAQILELEPVIPTPRAVSRTSTFRPPSQASKKIKQIVDSRPSLCSVILQSIVPMISVGIAIANIERCAAQPFLPIWLIMYSFIHLLVAAIRLVAHFKNTVYLRIAAGICGCIAVGFVILGIALVAWKWNSVTFDELILDQFCDPWLWRLSIIHALIGTLILSCVPVCCVCFMACDHFCRDYQRVNGPDCINDDSIKGSAV